MIINNLDIHLMDLALSNFKSRKDYIGLLLYSYIVHVNVIYMRACPGLAFDREAVVVDVSYSDVVSDIVVLVVV